MRIGFALSSVSAKTKMYRTFVKVVKQERERERGHGDREEIARANSRASLQFKCLLKLEKRKMERLSKLIRLRIRGMINK